MSLDKDHDENEALLINASCKLFPEEHEHLKAIARFDPEICNYSHAIRIAIKQFLYKRLQELDEQGIILRTEEGERIEGTGYIR